MTSAEPHVCITPVDDYRASPPLRQAVRRALRHQPAIVELLHASDPQRLVVVKPNWIQPSHEYQPDVWEPMITHPAVLLAVVEGLAELMGARGTICLCDAPHTYADFAGIVQRGNFMGELEALRRRWPELKLEVIDLRRETWRCEEEVVVERRPNPPDPRGYVQLNLGRDSLFFDHHGAGRYYGADYDTRVVNRHHAGQTQEYLLAGTPMACDLFVNVAKLKTHKKTGLTCCLKNLVGINGDKNWLPHHTEGSPQSGGDEFPGEGLAQALERHLKRTARRWLLGTPGLGTWAYRKLRNSGKRLLGDSLSVVRNGNWQGNDTCWRMALDLNRALLFGNSDGTWREARRPRPYLAIIDGIVGGEGNGPLCPDPVASRVLLWGSSPAAMDAAACRLMGFEPRQLPLVAAAFAAHRWPLAACGLDEVRVSDERVGATIALADVAPAVPGGFRPHFGWPGLRRAMEVVHGS